MLSRFIVIIRQLLYSQRIPNSRTKHIDTRYNYIRDIITKREISVQYISTHHMVADPLTKPIPRDVFLGHVNALGLRRA